MDDPQAVWRALSPEGLAAGILVITIIFSITTTVMLLLRAYIRTVHRLNGLEDYLMYIGGVLNLGHNAAVVYGCFTGIGTRDGKLNLPIMVEGAKTVTVWQLLYILSSPFIKVSICANLIRVAMKRRYIYPLQAMSGLAIAMSVMAFIVVFVQCRPFAASWTGQGKCISVDVIIIPTYVFSAANILVDWVVAILPAFIVWNLQLRRKLKLLSFGILGVGVLASIATIIRMPYIPSYAAKSDKLYKIGFIILWTVVELSLGILAGSLPSLRKFFKSLSKDQSTGEHGNMYGSDLVTIGGGNSAKPQRSAAYELNTTVVGRKSDSGDGNSDGVNDVDNDSTSRIIHVTRNVTQTREWERLR
ncbi:hypothetical protein LCI18_008684 [Fusarium solani-melongenae]|uniref:Uncharacterized protein n=1 Tax=Fusarium solani subsp. cucurbitae TaxID=2747967 RepID=A0ACD3Z8Z2_FUSSC|nr:hypothetical protein LCI18_008684 [Fusarium solani-melongenae]